MLKPLNLWRCVTAAMENDHANQPNALSLLHGQARCCSTCGPQPAAAALVHSVICPELQPARESCFSSAIPASPLCQCLRFFPEGSLYLTSARSFQAYKASYVTDPYKQKLPSSYARGRGSGLKYCSWTPSEGEA